MGIGLAAVFNHFEVLLIRSLLLWSYFSNLQSFPATKGLEIKAIKAVNTNKVSKYINLSLSVQGELRFRPLF